MSGNPPMDEGPRFFTVEEANALVAELELDFGRLAAARAELGPLVESLGGADVAVALLRGDGPPEGREADAARLERLAGEITRVIERVNGMGCLVKDVEAGLVDFYAVVEGEPAFLCWQFGEPAVSHWHPLEGGFAAREEIAGVSVRPPTFRN
ncbi:DUF2203 domain-containing protein [Anaeromyxobacter sp. SG64]|uniref:DUF2203 domain-containing protein n=2 Tax=unclassified Anaeromyxobacter TaxID=2620896 RepID=UPI001F56C98F|nr:DUF2203 domain-containing protein [Anaeromyxobacter sp. SG64]